MRLEVWEVAAVRLEVVAGAFPLLRVVVVAQWAEVVLLLVADVVHWLRRLGCLLV